MAGCWWHRSAFARRRGQRGPAGLPGRGGFGGCRRRLGHGRGRFHGGSCGHRSRAPDQLATCRGPPAPAGPPAAVPADGSDGGCSGRPVLRVSASRFCRVRPARARPPAQASWPPASRSRSDRPGPRFPVPAPGCGFSLWPASPLVSSSCSGRPGLQFPVPARASRVPGCPFLLGLAGPPAVRSRSGQRRPWFPLPARASRVPGFPFPPRPAGSPAGASRSGRRRPSRPLPAQASRASGSAGGVSPRPVPACGRRVGQPGFRHR